MNKRNNNTYTLYTCMYKPVNNDVPIYTAWCSSRDGATSLAELDPLYQLALQNGAISNRGRYVTQEDYFSRLGTPYTEQGFERVEYLHM